MTDGRRWVAELKEALQDARVQADATMALHTSFRAGGRADALIDIPRTETLRQALSFLKRENIPFRIIGNGTNILVSDRGYHGALLRICGETFETVTLTDGGTSLQAGCAASLGALAQTAARHGIAGYVPISGIPGSVGGALAMNAGAYGGEMKDIVESVQALDTAQSEIPEITLRAEEMAFGYRESIARKRPLVFLSAVFRAREKEAPGELQAQMKALAGKRREKQPLDLPSAGSAFKRPQGAFAAQLIDEAGLKGLTVGGAQVSEKHAGFVVNRGGATADDILTLMRTVRRRVKEATGIVLEPEVQILGEEL